MITEDYVSFEVAKLLKEKGFDEATFHEYSERGIRWFEEVLVNHNSQGGIACPTLQMTMKWLREKYSLEIYPYHQNSETYHTWWFEIINYPSTVSEYESNSIYTTYEQACESAIRYCLENLI